MPSWSQSEQIQGLDSEEVKDCCCVGLKASLVAQLVKNLPANVVRLKRSGFNPWVKKILWRRKWLNAPFLPKLSSVSNQEPHLVFKVRPGKGRKRAEGDRMGSSEHSRIFL